MDVRLRAMRWWDIEIVAALERRLFADDPPWSAEQFWSELAGVPQTRWYVVAEEDGGIVGYAGLLAPTLTDEPADVQTIAVAPGQQRRGIGMLLMEGLIHEARRREAAELLLEVRADNAGAQAFYDRYGFERIAVRRNYYAGNRDGMVLRKRLPGRARG